MSKTKKKKDWVVSLLDSIIVLLLFLMIYVGTNLLFEMKVEKDLLYLQQDAAMLSYELSNEDYARIIQGRYLNEINGEKGNAMFHALADYVEASSKYKIYAEKGYTDRAQEQKEIMDQAYKSMGDLVIYTKKIDAMFAVKHAAE